MKDLDGQYRLSQNFIISWERGELYISNPIEIFNRYKLQIGIHETLALLYFLKPANPVKALLEFLPEKRNGIKIFLEEMISKKILVDYEQITNEDETIFNMNKTLRMISGQQQLEYALKKAKKRHKNKFVDEIQRWYKDEKIMKMLKGRGLEIGGDVPGISQNISFGAFLLKLDYDASKQDSIPQDATDLPNFSNDEFDFIISSHTLEHLANPIKALKEWERVIKKGGYISDSSG